MTLLRTRPFAALWLGQSLSLLADWGLRTLLLIWVYRLTHAGLAVSAIGGAEALPLLVLAPVAGVYVDRWSRRRTLMGATLLRALVVLPALMVTTAEGVPLLLLVALLANAAGQFFQPAATALVPEIAGAEHTGQANSLLGLTQGAVVVGGPGLTAGLVAALGPQGTMVVLVGLYALALPCLARVPLSGAHDASNAAGSDALRREMAEGLAYVWRSRLLRSLLLCVVVFNLGAGGLSVIDVVFVTRILHLPPATAGVLLVANGVGGMVGGLLMTVLSRRVRQRQHQLVTLAVLGCGGAYLAYALAPSLVLASLVLALAGGIYIIGLVAYQTLVQLASAERVRGRVLSLFSTACAAGMLTSLAGTGALVDLWGVRAVIAVAAVLSLACGGVCGALVHETPTTAPPAEADARGSRLATLAGDVVI